MSIGPLKGTRETQHALRKILTVVTENCSWCNLDHFEEEIIPWSPIIKDLLILPL
jgi:hypothetical protein